MVIIRATKRVLNTLRNWAAEEEESETSLGDWCVNRIVIDRKPLLLLVSSKSLLPIVTPARDLKNLPERLPDLVAARLRRLGVLERVVEAEVALMAPVAIAPIRDRSVLGIMVEFAKMAPSYLVPDDWNETTLPFLESWLARTPCHAGGRSQDVIWPDKAARNLLNGRGQARIQDQTLS